MPRARAASQRFSQIFPLLKRNAVLRKKKKSVVVSLLSQEAIATVDEEYLSFSIDISVVAGGFWWEGSAQIKNGLGANRISPLNLNSNKLDRFVQALGPAYLRVGGSEADKIHYFEVEEQELKYNLILTRNIWDELHAFLKRNKLKFMFTFKYGLFTKAEHGNWKGTEIQQLLEYTRKQKYVIDICELGNELNAYWAFHGLNSQPRASKLAQDYSTFIQLIRANLPSAKICGPGSAFWPVLGETIKPFSNITQKFLQSLSAQLDIVDWHYYPYQSTRSPVRTRTAKLKSVVSPAFWLTYSKYCAQIRSWRDRYQPEADLWTGETGSAQCGGQAKISDRFASCFWWADQLGRGAINGQKVMVRQSLIGGDYGLLDRVSLKARPDYWVCWLWCRLMGTKVYAVQSTDPDVLVYCHGHPSAKKKTLLIINASDREKHLKFNGLGSPKKRYTLSANKLDSKNVYINGVKPRFNRGEVSLSDFPKIKKADVPAFSINFWCFAN